METGVYVAMDAGRAGGSEGIVVHTVLMAMQYLVVLDPVSPTTRVALTHGGCWKESPNSDPPSMRALKAGKGILQPAQRKTVRTVRSAGNAWSVACLQHVHNRFALCGLSRVLLQQHRLVRMGSCCPQLRLLLAHQRRLASTSTS